jgi:RNA polymerase sigma-70 factor (ECF subfamily)
VVDDALVAGAKAGDPDAWRALHQAHAGRLVAWLGTRPTGDAMASAEDVAAEAWLVAASKICDFDGTSSDFAGYLFGIARKLGASAHRRAQRRRTDPGEVEQHLPSEPDATLGVDAHDWVRDAIASLPARERDVVGLVDGLGFDNRTAAEALGITAVAVRVARHRGLRRLRGLLPRDGPASRSAPPLTTEVGDDDDDDVDVEVEVDLMVDPAPDPGGTQPARHP